jgi:EAL domain-containing protein (putative c-di-GMP-specific phosphodiesterase class I)
MSHQETRFQPIVETSRHEVIGYDCLSVSFTAAIQAAGRQRDPNQRYFVRMMPLTEVSPKVVDEAGLHPRNLVLSMAESDLIGDSARLRVTQDRLQRLGFRIAFDNVGVGANALAMITALRPDYVRIDGGVVGHIERPVFAATVRRLVEVSEDLGVLVIATGVERPRTVENLWLLGVQTMQGPLFGQPSPYLLTTPESDLQNLAHALQPKSRVVEFPLVATRR